MSSKLLGCIQYWLDKLFPDFITVWLDKNRMVHSVFDSKSFLSNDTVLVIKEHIKNPKLTKLFVVSFSYLDTRMILVEVNKLSYITINPTSSFLKIFVVLHARQINIVVINSMQNMQ